MKPAATLPPILFQRRQGYFRRSIFFSVVLSLAASFLCAVLMTGVLHWLAWFLGWFAAALNAVASVMLQARAVGTNINRFLLWGVLGNGLRIMLLLVSILAIAVLAPELVRRSFIVSFFAGLFVLMGFEIFALLSISPPKDPEGVTSE
jgi:hypothetical protein